MSLPTSAPSAVSSTSHSDAQLRWSVSPAPSQPPPNAARLADPPPHTVSVWLSMSLQLCLHDGGNLRQRCRELFRAFTPRLRQVCPSATAATEHRCHGLGQLSRMDAPG